jgi:co-chaperonin GroES (HSP10)
MPIKPIYDYCLGKKIEEDTGVVIGSDIRDTHQYFEIIAIGDGRYDNDGIIIPMPVAVGDKVLVQKHAAEGDTPPELYSKGLALFMASRIMAKEGK